MELERESNVLVISHAAIIRCLLGYFLDIPTGTYSYYIFYFSFFATKAEVYVHLTKSFKVPDTMRVYV